MLRKGAFFGSWLLGLSVTACAFEQGDPYGRVRAELDLAYELRDDRDVGDDWQKLVNEYEVRIDELVVAVDAIEIVDAGGSGQTASFDPSNPPPGYSLCHGGHCHADDGSLVSYEDIAAELAAGGEGSSIVARFSPGPVDALEPEVRSLACASGCVLGAGHLSLVRVSVTSLEARGMVRDGLADPRIEGEIPFTASIDLAPEEGALALDAGLDLPVDDDHAPEIRLTVVAHPSAAAFDGIDFAGLTNEEPLDLGTDDGAVDTVRASFAELELGVAVERTE